MHADRSPFPVAWVGLALEGVGLDALRPRRGTYGRYDVARLPPLPVALDGGFGWLAGEPVHAEWPIGAPEDRAGLAGRADRLLAAEPGLPPPFAGFLRRPELHGRIRSYTACFLDLCPCAVAAPGGGGRLVRFLADQQGCFWWYVFLADGGDHAVVLSSTFHGARDEWADDRPVESPLFVAADVESFLCRYWLENEIAFYAGGDEAELPALASAYLDAYRRLA